VDKRFLKFLEFHLEKKLEGFFRFLKFLEFWDFLRFWPLTGFFLGDWIGRRFKGLGFFGEFLMGWSWMGFRMFLGVLGMDC
jgi:hypothetical protein